MSVSSFQQAKKRVCDKAEQVAEAVFMGVTEEVHVPLIFRDFIHDMKTHGAAPMLHTIGMARFKEHFKRFQMSVMH